MAGRRTFYFEGLGVSDGIAIGPAFVVETEGGPAETYDIATNDIDAEIERFRHAVALAREEIVTLGKQVAEKIDRQQAAIFDAHVLMLEDPQIIDRAVEIIRRDRQNAESVLWEITRELGEQMKALGDVYFAERNHDLYDVSRRVTKFLRRLHSTPESETPQRHCIVVANDLGPAETAQFTRDQVLGFCLNEGGATSHAAILAKALGIPAIVGLEFITHYIRSGDVLILDATEGKVILNPSPTQIEQYRKRAAVLEKVRETLLELRDVPAITPDGCRVTMMANIELPEELDSSVANGAEGIGLLRTEFLYLNRTMLPEEDEQAREYRAVFERMGDRPVILRTLDLGGDKMPDRSLIQPEMNPFMGMRAVRLCLSRPDLFRTQLRAMLKAAIGRDLHILVPMVSGLSEIRTTRQMLDDLMRQARTAGQQLPRRVLVGAMIEIPSAALIVDVLCREVDFLSIGTNDLVQYTLAVDRTNKTVAHLYRETHPAVLQLIQRTLTAARENDIPVSVCGEMASEPRLAVLLVGMGIRTLSMGPTSIPVVKRLLRTYPLHRAEQLAREVLQLSTSEEVDQHLEQALRASLDTLRLPLHEALSSQGEAVPGTA